MDFSFDETIDRSKSWSLKWQRYAGRDILPLWIGDTDFKAPPAVTEALQQRLEHGVFGYTVLSDNLNQALCEYLERGGWQDTDPDWFIWLPSLVHALNLCVIALSNQQDGVIAPCPVYPPFFSAVTRHGRELLKADMSEQKGRLVLEPEALAKASARKRAKLLLLCSPHNPGGTVFTERELREIGEYCCGENMFVCSDEVHKDLVLDKDVRHLHFASLSKEFAQRSVTLVSASKTFNIAGLNCAAMIVPNPELRQRLLKARDKFFVGEPNLFGYVACEAAWRHGEPWRLELINYLKENRDLLIDGLAETQGLRVLRPQASYFLWIDMRAIGLKLPAKALEEYGVGLSEGAPFGAPQWARLNFGACRARVSQALERLKNGMTALAAQAATVLGN